jgi:hypothetical protein
MLAISRTNEDDISEGRWIRLVKGVKQKQATHDRTDQTPTT